MLPIFDQMRRLFVAKFGFGNVFVFNSHEGHIE